MDIGNFVTDPIDMVMDPATGAFEQEQVPAEDLANKALVGKIAKIIKADKEYFKEDFKQMRDDMYMARIGADKDWNKDNYTANIAGRHVKQKTAALFAKNPKATAKRRPTMDFAIWDETPGSLQLAMETIQMAEQLMQQGPTAVDPMTGMPIPPELPPGFEEAQALMQDFQQGVERRTVVAKIAKTLELAYAYHLSEQQPLSFKRGMKKLVRRALTTGVAYVELNYQREYGSRPGIREQLADVRSRLDHLRNLSQKLAEGETDFDAAEKAELEHATRTLQAEPEVVVREGLIIDYPKSTRVIPDKRTEELDGWIGSRHLTIEYLYTSEEVEEIFGVDLGKKYNSYYASGEEDNVSRGANFVDDDGKNQENTPGMVLVWKHFDKPSGLVYYLADGVDTFLREPAAPDVFVEEFFPVYSLSFNDVEDEDKLFPPSDVALMAPMQMEYNRSRQGMREHRRAARPRFIHARGSLQEDDLKNMAKMQPFDNITIDLAGDQEISKIIQAMPMPGVDPNLYETNPIFTDTQVVVGSQESQFGGVARATATESSIAANSTASAANDNVDDLDSFLTTIARASGQILMREMSEEKAREIAGIGAVWPEQTVSEIVNDLFLEVEAGSSGKPNQAVEINNLKELLPILMQLPGIDPMWLAKQSLQRFDDRLDLTEALIEGIPSIVSQNRMQQAAPEDPNADPAAQGAEGANNGPQPPEQGGSGAAFGSNQV